MYSDKKNVLQLVALLRAHGIRRAVLCPGSRNVPLVQAFATCEDFECFSVTDERSAGPSAPSHRKHPAAAKSARPSARSKPPDGRRKRLPKVPDGRTPRTPPDGG